jgi:hypothetical protein
MTNPLIMPAATVESDTPANTTSRAELTAEFRDQALKSVEGIFGQARVLIKGREELPHGEFTDWAHEMLSARKGDPDVARRKADLIIGLAEHPVLSNRCHWHRFPCSPRTLYEIGLIRPQSRLLRYIADGSINPGLTREEAIGLKGGRSQPRPAFIVSAAIVHLQRQLEKLSDEEAVRNLRDDVGSLTPDQLKQFARRLTNLAKMWEAR